MNDPTRPDLSGLLCPHCRVNLVMSDRQGIEIDYCPQCRGVWLDRGELDKIIERSAGQIIQPGPAQRAENVLFSDADRKHRDDREHSSFRESGHGGKHGGRRKSWFSELFD